MKRLLLATAALVALTSSVQAQNFAARDDVAQLTTNGFLDRKDSVSPTDFYAYWLNVHGPLATRIDGIHQYWQHHLDRIDADLLPATLTAVGVSTDLAVADQLEGLAEVTFASEQDRAGLGASPAAAQLMVDEQNVFKGTSLHSSVAGNTRTLLDVSSDPTPQGDRAGYTVILLVQANEAGDRAAFRARIVDAFASGLTGAEGARKVRYSLFEAYDASGWDTPNVDNDRTQDQAYDAWIELGFETRTAARAALAEHATALTDADLVQAVHAYPEREVYTLVYDGAPTLEGLRGFAIQEIVDAVHADNQNQPDVLQSLFGSAVEIAD